MVENFGTPHLANMPDIGEEHFLKCYYYNACQSNKNERLKFRMCAELLEREDYDIVIGWYADDPEMTNMKYVDGMDLTQKSFCEADNKTRIGCETRLPEATCQRFQEVTKCAGILYQELELNGKCGVDVL
ncbi:hypothetical protein CEXT_353301 [Caerostris extrusa]|uniref:Uncharacterized protein n=1 Tax=Caerostris extrusa TaxID=172846 RepID=A0AAV4XDZ2_CAEEX|nr:hypothetical protein CEXT_353301 [Caerostris extrusa]